MNSTTKNNIPYNVLRDNKTPYFLGFSITPTEVSFSLTDTNYNVLDKNGVRMEGTRSLDIVNDAKDRRTARLSRRSHLRENNNKEMINKFFKDALAKVDKDFLQREKESGLYEEDKTVNGCYSFFNDENYTDKEFYNEFPTIYHLRELLMHSKDPQDLRFYKIAISHIIKRRGHALYSSLSAKDVCSFELNFNRLNKILMDFFNFEITYKNKKDLIKTFQNSQLSKKEKQTRIYKLCNLNSKKESFVSQKKAIVNAIIGFSSRLSVIYDDVNYEEDILDKFNFGELSDEKINEYYSLLETKFAVFDAIKSVYDWIILSGILGGHKNISAAKVSAYKQHDKDLKALKRYVRKYCPEKYYLIFKQDKKPDKKENNVNNYVSYTGHKKHKKTGKGLHLKAYRCTQIEFCKFLKKTLGPECLASKYQDMFNRIELGTFMPKVNTTDNAVIPTQLHRVELVKILDNAKRDYPEVFDVADNDGITVYDKILAIFDFRIPYYVGPLNENSPFSWVVRKEAGKIYPWNFDKKVDARASAQKFIERMINSCSLLPQYPVIPKCSLLYSKYCVLNEINNIRVNGNKISVKEKQDIYNDLFLTRKSVTEAGLRRYLINKGYSNSSDDKDNKELRIGGVKSVFNSSMMSYLLLKEYNLSEKDMEYVIWVNTIFSGAPEIITECINEKFGHMFDEKTLAKLSNMPFSGWSALSREVLTTVSGKDTKGNEYENIMDALWKTNDNLEVLKGSKYTFSDKINEINDDIEDKNYREIIDGMNLPPSTKRPVITACRQAEELIKIMGYSPEKIFVKTLRYNGEKETTLSRKNKLIALYKKNKYDKHPDYCEAYNELLSAPDSLLKKKKYYLYFLQLGRDIYTNEKITFNDLAVNDPNDEDHYYDTDHIYPKSKVDDDSISLNLVLTLKSKNQDKTDVYPVDVNIRKKMASFWYTLLRGGYITTEKYNRLTRKTPLTEEELIDFVSSQIVDANQATKAITKVFKSIFNETPLVYVKQELITGFRHTYDMISCKEVNDISYAKDAYLAIVVGNVFDEVFTKNRRNFIKGLLKNHNEKDKFSIQRIFKRNIKDVWTAKNDETLNVVRNEVMNEEDVVFTRYSFDGHGKLFDVNPCIGKKSQFARKQSGPLSDISKYGGYNNTKTHHFCFIKYKSLFRNKLITKTEIVPINIVDYNEFERNPIQFLENKGFKEPEIIIEHTKICTRFEYDGLMLDLSGKSGISNCVKIAKQLIIPYEDRVYLKLVEKCFKELEEVKHKKYVVIPDKKHYPDKYNNLRIYKLLYKKMMTDYKVAYNGLGIKIKAATNMFKKLNVDDQIRVLHHMLSILNNCNGGDLRLIGYSKNSGCFTPSVNITNRKSVVMYDYSVTGLYCRRSVVHSC